MPRKKTPGEAGSSPGVDLTSLLRALGKRLGDRAPGRLSDVGAYPIREWIPTGIASLDQALGGGWPVPSIIMVEGPESVGKTTLTTYLSGVFQKCGFVVYRIEAEEGGQQAWDERLGLNPASALGTRTSSIDEALMLFLEGARALTKLKMRGFLVFDSLAATQTARELVMDVTKDKVTAQAPGDRAGVISRMVPKLVEEMRDQPLAIVVVNQVRDNIGAHGPFAPKTRTPGGRAIKHFAHVRLDISRIGQIQKAGKPVGIHSKIRVVKNKLTPPFGVSFFDIFFDPPRVVEGDPDGDTE